MKEKITYGMLFVKHLLLKVWVVTKGWLSLHGNNKRFRIFYNKSFEK